MPAKLHEPCQQSSGQPPHARPECADIPQVITQPEITTHNMFQEPHSLRLDELVDHVAEDGADGVEPLVCVADIR